MGTPPLRMGSSQLTRPPRRGARPLFQIGGVARSLPTLSGPVGPENLRARIPQINAPADVALVDDCFESIAALRPAPTAPPGETANLLAVAEAVRGYKSDRAAAIVAFQRLEDIRDEEERADGVINPDGLTWEALFAYGQVARNLDTTRDRNTNPADYIHTGGFDAAVFEAKATRRFGAKANADGGRYNVQSIAGMLDLLGRISRDPRIIDIRWIAYILATAMWESYGKSEIANPNGTGTQSVRRWASPLEEGGKGRLNAKDIKDYYLPVKVAPAPGGGATVTEQDGDIFIVATTGAITRGASKNVGSNAFAAATATYAKAAGVEHAYYGRGYCQLTWWNNYASTGAEVGLGLELLFNPERALEPDIAYEVMAHCMVYGSGFANGKRLQQYLAGAKTDYVGARAMVNGINENRKIAVVAEVFEQCLLKARR